MSTYGGSAISPGHCAMHGYHGRTFCPRCSSAATIPLHPKPSPPLAGSHPWVCPKCGRVYSWMHSECRKCNRIIDEREGRATYGGGAA